MAHEIKAEEFFELTVSFKRGMSSTVLLDSLDEKGYAIVKKETLARLYPVEISAGIRRALLQTPMDTGPLCRIYRKAGFEINERYEDEQVFIIDRFLRFVLANPEWYGQVIADDIQTARDKALAVPNGV